MAVPRRARTRTAVFALRLQKQLAILSTRHGHELLDGSDNGAGSDHHIRRARGGAGSTGASNACLFASTSLQLAGRATRGGAACSHALRKPSSHPREGLYDIPWTSSRYIASTSGTLTSVGQQAEDAHPAVPILVRWQLSGRSGSPCSRKRRASNRNALTAMLNSVSQRAARSRIGRLHHELQDCRTTRGDIAQDGSCLVHGTSCSTRRRGRRGLVESLDHPLELLPAAAGRRRRGTGSARRAHARCPRCARPKRRRSSGRGGRKR